ncbi:MAG: class II aldolase/adducin family protein [Ruminococcus sp.]|nr:class II aldolase/adducin family protein [Candidatus Apopatosoma intestinale]
MMIYDESTARALVIEAGHKLVETRLIARTWGNISARISENEFIITPSGRAYETMKPDDLVKVRIRDLSVDGDGKPSSEKGIHAGAYSLRPECGFIIHTHQFYASAVCAEGEDVSSVPCAKYGLPGTKKLMKNVEECMARHKDADSFLLEKHGALVLGASFDDAFEKAEKLESLCRDRFVSRVGNIPEDGFVAEYAKSHRSLAAYIDDYAQLVGFTAKIDRGAVKISESDDETAMQMIVLKNCAAALYAKHAKPLSVVDALLQRTVYLLKYSKLKGKS